MRPSWTASYELGTVVRALERGVGVLRSVQVHCSGVDLTEARCRALHVLSGQPWLMPHLGPSACKHRTWGADESLKAHTLPILLVTKLAMSSKHRWTLSCL